MGCRERPFFPVYQKQQAPRTVIGSAWGFVCWVLTAVSESSCVPSSSLEIPSRPLVAYDLQQMKPPFFRQRAFLLAWEIRHSAVHIGQLIGRADNTGLSSGDHLHFELKPVEYFPNKPSYHKSGKLFHHLTAQKWAKP